MDRRIKICIIITTLVTILIIIFINSIGITDPFSRYMEGQIVTGTDRSDAINITLSDPYVQDILKSGIGGLYYNYSIQDVVISKYHAAGPGFGSFINYYETLPAVVFIVGNESRTGINIYTFVDLADSRVAYIGYVARWGYDDGQFTYQLDPDGISISDHIDNMDHILYTFSNITIIDTGYKLGQNLTDEEMIQVTDIAVNDSQVKGIINGREYMVKDIASGYTMSNGVIYAYPNVDIRVKNGTGWDSICATVDVRNKKVIDIQQNAPWSVSA